MPGKGWPKRPPISATFESRCPECHEEILVGDEIYYSEWHDAYICKLCKEA